MVIKPKFMHLSCHNAIVVWTSSSMTILVAEMDVVSFNEPYICEESVRGVSGW